MAPAPLRLQAIRLTPDASDTASFDEALRLANASRFALTGGVYSQTPGRIRRTWDVRGVSGHQYPRGRPRDLVAIWLSTMLLFASVSSTGSGMALTIVVSRSR